MAELESKKEDLALQRREEILEYCKENGLINRSKSYTAEEREVVAKKFLITEISSTLNKRKQLEHKLGALEPEVTDIQRNVLMNQQKAVAFAEHQQHLQQQQQHHLHQQAAQIQHHQPPPLGSPQQKSQNPSPHQQNIFQQHQSQQAINPAKKNLSRNRSQEWPDIPDVGKINENNPEVLAKKILETGRKIEAGKMSSTTTTSSSPVKLKSEGKRRNSSVSPGVAATPPPQLNSLAASVLPKVLPLPGAEAGPPPKVNFFEDRLHNLITTCLNDGSAQQAPPNVHAQQNAFPSTHQVQQTQQPARPVTPSRPQPVQDLSIQKKKKIQLSPDICMGHERGNHMMGSPNSVDMQSRVSSVKKALRQHLNLEPKPGGGVVPSSVVSPKGGSEKRSIYSRTIDDLVSGEIARSLGIPGSAKEREGSNTVAAVNFSPPVRAVYSPISRPNSNDPNVEAPVGLSGAGSSYPHRASVLVKTPHVPVSVSGSHEDGMEGLAAGLKASFVSMAKTSAESLQSKNGFVGPPPPMAHHIASTMMSGMPQAKSLVMNSVEVRSNRSPSPAPSLLTREKVKVGDGPVGNVIEVVLGSSGPSDTMDCNRNTGSSSVLQVSRKRVSDLNSSVCIQSSRRK